MFGSGMNIKNYDWYKGCLQKATMKLTVNGKCYWITRTEHPEENYFKVDGDVETESISLVEYKEKLNEIFAYDEVSLRRLREFVEENMSYNYEIHYRDVNGLIVPYIELDMINKSDIELVTVGPLLRKDEGVKYQRSLREMLNREGYKDIDVIASEVGVRY